MKIAFILPLLIFGVVFWLSPNDRSVPYLVSQTNKNMKIIKEKKQQLSLLLNGLTLAYPQYRSDYIQALTKDSLCQVAIQENWNAAFLDSLLLHDLERYQKKSFQTYFPIENSVKTHNNLLINNLKSLINQQKGLSFLDYTWIQYGDTYFSLGQNLQTFQYNPTIKLCDSLTMSFIISNQDFQSQNVIEAVSINGKSYPVQQKNGRKYAIYKTTKTEKPQEIIIKIKVNYRNQQPKIIERKLNILQ